MMEDAFRGVIRGNMREGLVFAILKSLDLF